MRRGGAARPAGMTDQRNAISATAKTSGRTTRNVIATMRKVALAHFHGHGSWRLKLVGGGVWLKVTARQRLHARQHDRSQRGQRQHR